MKWGKRQARRHDQWRLFFATDLHGAEVCFRKFLNAAKFYEAEVLVLGGDITGKRIAPVIANGDGWTVRLQGRDVICRSESELEEAEQKLRDGGAYPYRTDAATADRLTRSEADLDALQEEAVRAQLERWGELAAERIEGRELIFIAGNDDPWSADQHLARWPGANVDGGTAELRGLTVVGLGASNKTPWNSPRECSEDELALGLDRLLAGVGGPTIYNVHVPPCGGRLDICARLDDELRPVLHNGEPELIHAGSTAVLEAIQRYQPAVSLHGHIHESGNVDKIGSSVAVNPGSDYGTGVLRGALLTFGGSELLNHQLVSG